MQDKCDMDVVVHPDTLEGSALILREMFLMSGGMNPTQMTVGVCMFLHKTYCYIYVKWR